MGSGERGRNSVVETGRIGGRDITGCSERYRVTETGRIVGRDRIRRWRKV